MTDKLLDFSRQWLLAVISNRSNLSMAVIGLAVCAIIAIEVSWGTAFAFLAALVGLLDCLNTLVQLNERAPANNASQSIALTIQQSAKTYMLRHYKTLGVAGVLAGLLLLFVQDSEIVAGFITGAIFSGLAGYLGMTVSIHSNERTAQAALQGWAAAFNVAFKSATLMGLLVASLALLGIVSCYAILILLGNPEPLNALVGFALGCSLVSVFARIGGGIFCKAADIACDAAAKMHEHEEVLDSRNPALIAQRVGISVRDGVGMAGDLFETYAAVLMATMILAGILTGGLEAVIVFPLLLGGAALLASVIAVNLVKPTAGKIFSTLLRAVACAAGLSALFFYPLSLLTFSGGIRMGATVVSAHGVYFAALIGFALSAALVAVAEYYSSARHPPLRDVVAATRNGIANVFNTGLMLAMQSTALPVLAISTAIWAAHALAGLFGVAVAATAMLSLMGLVVGLDVFSPIAANAESIAELAHANGNRQSSVNALVAAGRHMQALTRGYALGGAALAAVVIFADYTDFLTATVGFVLLDYRVVVGLLLGALIPYLFVALLMTAVNRPASELINEVRRQWRTQPGILDKSTRPDYQRALDILMRLSLREISAPALLALLIPLLAGFLFGAEILGGLLLGALIAGLLLAISLGTAGNMWSNARLYIAEGRHGGDTAAEKAALTTDAVGAPLKDLIAPALGVMIKLVSIVGLLIAPWI